MLRKRSLRETQRGLEIRPGIKLARLLAKPRRSPRRQEDDVLLGIPRASHMGGALFEAPFTACGVLLEY